MLCCDLRNKKLAEEELYILYLSRLQNLFTLHLEIMNRRFSIDQTFIFSIFFCLRQANHIIIVIHASAIYTNTNLSLIRYRILCITPILSFYIFTRFEHFIFKTTNFCKRTEKKMQLTFNTYIIAIISCFIIYLFIFCFSL